MKKKQTIHDPVRSWTKLLLVMKLSVLLFFIFTFTLQAKTYSQASDMVSLNFNKVKLIDVITEIEKQTDYYFYYNVDLELYQVDKLKTKNQDFREVLNMILPGLGLDYSIVDHYIVIKRADEKDHKQVANKQQFKITGTITDAATDEPLPGVNIVIEGTSTGVISDLKGNYSIDVAAENAVLVFSYIGYLTEKVPVSEQSVIDIKLSPDIKGLDEVVVIGYGTQKKVNLTGSVSTVDSKMLELRPVNNVVQSLQGLVPGLNITQTSGGLIGTTSTRPEWAAAS